MTEAIDRSAVKDIRVGTWEGDNETPAIFFSFTTGAGFVDTLEWLDGSGKLIDYPDSHLMHSHLGNELYIEDVAMIRRRLEEHLSAR
ncbi:hypothetical protein NXC12_CH03017 [Rhizobium etli]|uniref:Uncharacterized protein n=1 Tax=Rhizobium etli TaxID=29449 RepID=A0AAN1BGW8_RHIET|nr:hypothetical protein [Rhizobium etli]ARQ11010.1 hypothetical protein NXC12_CH03017 [Rhizobium etli]